MKLIAAVIASLFCINTFAALPFPEDSPGERTNKRAIVDKILQLEDLVTYEPLSQEQLSEINNLLDSALEAAKDIGPKPPVSSVLCMRQGNGLFYPYSVEEQKVVGPTRYNAGHATLDQCKETLVQPRYEVTCYRQENALYYPSLPSTGEIIGSSRYNAGHASHSLCHTTLPVIGQNLACYKQENALYYPSKTLTGEIVGSDKYNAGYPTHSECLQVLP